MIRKLSAFGLAVAMSVAPLRAQGPRDQIEVHGQWVIDVRQPDGTLVEHRAFHNDVIEAPRALSGLLGGAYGRLDHLRVELRNDNGVQPCTGYPFFGGSSWPSPCHIIPAVTDSNCGLGDNCFQNLSVDPPGTALTLHGSAVASRDGGGLSSVRFVAVLARPNGALEEIALTGIAIAPIALVRGQTVQVSVTISFM